MKALIETDDGTISVDVEHLRFDGSHVEYESERHPANRVTVKGRDNTVYVVERHDADYESPARSRLTQSVTTALRFANEEMDEHSADEWRKSESDENKNMTFFPDEHRAMSGRVTIRERTLHE